MDEHCEKIRESHVQIGVHLDLCSLTTQASACLAAIRQVVNHVMQPDT